MKVSVGTAVLSVFSLVSVLSPGVSATEQKLHKRNHCKPRHSTNTLSLSTTSPVSFANPTTTTTTASPHQDTTTTAAPHQDTTTTAAPPHDTTTTAAPPHDTTTTAAPPHDTTTTASPRDDTTSSTSTTSTGTSSSSAAASTTTSSTSGSSSTTTPAGKGCTTTVRPTPSPVAVNDLCPFAPVSPTPEGSKCAVEGWLRQFDEINTYASSTGNYVDCMKACLSFGECLSFLYNKRDNNCRLLSKSVSDQDFQSRKSSATFWDKACFAVSESCGEGDYNPTMTAAPTDSAATTTSTDTETPVQTGDSPPLDVGEVTFPEDKSWTATYTYDEVELPTFAPQASVVPDAPAETTVCFVDPEAEGNSFHLMDPHKGYLINKNGRPGTPDEPKTEAEATAMGRPDDYVPPTYTFVMPDGAATGLYDIMLVGSNLYLALSSDGSIIFTDSSTRGFVQPNGQTVITTVFGVSCKGYMTVSDGTTEYIWKASADGYTSATPGTRVDSDPGILLLPTAALGGDSTAQKRSIGQKRAAPRCADYNGKFTTGAQPRCPNYPSKILSNVRSGVRGPQSNGCGPANGFDFVPDWTFTQCCNRHDLCFDDPECGLFETCNRDFHSCMRGDGCAWTDHWWSWWARSTCLGLADFYGWAVTTSSGRDAFKSAQDERGKCFCPNEPRETVCKTGDDRWECLGVWADSNNCGGCGNKCPRLTHCAGGACRCDQDQCGRMCLNLLTHPRNCGACGNVCPSGYCYKGKCYDPPKDVCAPVDGFTNGGFASGNLDGWWTEGSSASTVGVGFDGGAEGNDSLDVIIDVPAPSGFFSVGPMGKTLAQNVKLCPGQRYELTFQGRRVYGDGACFVSATLGPRTLLTTTMIPTSGIDWQYYGQYLVDPFNVGDEGTFQDGLSLRVTFKVQVMCLPTRNTLSSIRLDSFSVYPI